MDSPNTLYVVETIIRDGAVWAVREDGTLQYIKPAPTEREAERDWSAPIPE